MRVVSGTARGCKLQPVPGMNTRPTTDRVKEKRIQSDTGSYCAVPRCSTCLRAPVSLALRRSRAALLTAILSSTTRQLTAS